MHVYLRFHRTDLCSLKLTIGGHAQQLFYKNITVPDDDGLVNPRREVYLNLKSPDYRVDIQENSSRAIVWIEDNDRM